MGEAEVKVYCPKCNGVFETPLSTIDGAFFGRTFAHFFLLVRSQLVPKQEGKTGALKPYDPTLFGYKINHTSRYWNFGGRRGKDAAGGAAAAPAAPKNNGRGNKGKTKSSAA